LHKIVVEFWRTGPLACLVSVYVSVTTSLTCIGKILKFHVNISLSAEFPHSWHVGQKNSNSYWILCWKCSGLGIILGLTVCPWC